MTITLAVGQAIPWPPAPMGIAQIAELRRRRVMLVYPFKNGRIAHPLVSVDDLARLLEHSPLLFALNNPFNRAVRGRTRTYALTPPAKPAPVSEGGVDEE